MQDEVSFANAAATSDAVSEEAVTSIAAHEVGSRTISKDAVVLLAFALRTQREALSNRRRPIEALETIIVSVEYNVRVDRLSVPV